MDKELTKDVIYGLYLLEEIRHLTAQSMLIQARTYDAIARKEVPEHTDEQTYNEAFKIAQQSEATIAKKRKEFE